MGYVIAGLLVLLIVSAFVAFLVLQSKRREPQAAAEERDYGEGTPGSDLGIIASDERTPLGDTDQHAGEQTDEGITAEDPERAPGTAGTGTGGTAAPGQGGVGGEAEGGRLVTPESERLANRPR